MSYTRVEEKTVVQTEGTPDYYDVSLRLSTHGIVGGGGTGGGSTTPFPLQPPGTALHWWSGTFNIHGDGGGGGSGEGWSSPNGVIFPNNAQFTYEVSWADDGHLYAREWGIQSVFGMLNDTGSNFVAGDFSSFPDGPTTHVYAGSFTVPDAAHFDATRLAYMISSAAASPHDQDAHGVLSFWVDPDGWDPGTAPVPVSGEPVPDETPTPAPNGTTTVFTVAHPYAPGSLRVEMNGVELDAGVDFTETTATTFTFNDPPPTNAQIVVWYLSA